MGKRRCAQRLRRYFRLLPKHDLTLRQSAFGGFCVKSRKDGKAVYRSPEGAVTRPAPHYLQPETDWPAAAWYDYTIALTSGKTIGATVVDHPATRLRRGTIST